MRGDVGTGKIDEERRAAKFYISISNYCEDFEVSRNQFFAWISLRGFLTPLFWRSSIRDHSAELPVLSESTLEDGIEFMAPPVLTSAPDAIIHEVISRAYDEAAAANRKPPNIKELPAAVLLLLNADGYQTSRKRIQDLGSQERHVHRRRKTGRTIASENSRSGNKDA